MPNVLTYARRVAVDLLFPPRCALCGVDGSLLCGACANALPAASGVRCDICWTSLEPVGDRCQHCASTPPSFEMLRSPYVMADEARRLVLELKYEGLTSLAEPMGNLMADATLEPVDIVVPVPLHPSRQRSRGYNQAALLAREIANRTGTPCDEHAARRIRATMPLAKTMHRDERRAIVEGAFEGCRERVEGRAILLVDDVATTGATLDVCSAALLVAGAVSVRCLTWART